VDVPLLPSSRPRRLAAISHQPPTILTAGSGLQNQSYVTTILSWCQASLWGPRPECYYCQIVAGLLMWGPLSDERKGLSFIIAAGPRQRSLLYCCVSVAAITWRLLSHRLAMGVFSEPFPSNSFEQTLLSIFQDPSLFWNYGSRPSAYMLFQVTLFLTLHQLLKSYDSDYIIIFKMGS
jgi:hypothetical protein